MQSRLRIFIGSLAALALLAIGLILSEPRAEPPNLPPDETQPISTTPKFSAVTSSNANARVLRVVDGDTFVAAMDQENGEWRVRMLGIDTPESVDPRRPVECFGKEAADKLRTLVEGRRVRLASDPEADERDAYGRLLRNVFLEDGTDVNATMVREGFAQAYLRYPLKRERKSELRKLEETARASSTGLWSKDVCPVR